MNTLHEALSRERMLADQHRARQAALTRELAAQRRWHRVSAWARAVETRHARRVDQLTVR